MRLSIIAAMSANRVIGRGNALPWKLPPDLRRFKELTMGHWVLMGRKTFDSIGRPLPGRSTVVITRRQDFAAPGVRVAHSIEEAVKMAAGDMAASEMAAGELAASEMAAGEMAAGVEVFIAGDEVFIAGGEQIYRQALPIADRIYLTVIEKDFDGDAFFPEFDPSDWQLVSEESHQASGDIDFGYRFLLYDRKKG